MRIITVHASCLLLMRGAGTGRRKFHIPSRYTSTCVGLCVGSSACSPRAVRIDMTALSSEVIALSLADWGRWPSMSRGMTGSSRPSSESTWRVPTGLRGDPSYPRRSLRPPTHCVVGQTREDSLAVASPHRSQDSVIRVKTAAA